MRKILFVGALVAATAFCGLVVSARPAPAQGIMPVIGSGSFWHVKPQEMSARKKIKKARKYVKKRVTSQVTHNRCEFVDSRVICAGPVDGNWNIMAPESMRGRSLPAIDTFSFSGDTSLVSRARAYMGQTAAQIGVRRTLWCGAFMAKIAPRAAAKLKNPNWARDWATLPRTAKRVGAIAVLARGKHGGHVGVVSGIDRHGNPIIISGNHNRRVGEAVYPARRVIAYVSGS